MGQIVVGYDGSDSGKVAVDAAVSLAKDLGDGVVLVFGYAPPGIWGGEIAEHEEAIEELGEKIMAEAKERVTAQGVQPEVEMAPRRAADALMDVANRRRARMIVVGSYGEGPVKGAILGSTPYRLLHQSEVPVLVVRSNG